MPFDNRHTFNNRNLSSNVIPKVGVRSSTIKVDRNYSVNYLYLLEDLSVQYTNNKVLKSISLVINPQEKIFLIGHSGAGKTTFLKLLTGIVRPSEGKIIGPSIMHHNWSNFVSLIFQDFRLVNDWSLENNLWMSYDPKVYKDKNEFDEDMINLSKLFGIKDRLHLKISCSNEGMKQKIAIIRSLLTRPKILLADEPTSALDKTNTIKLYEILNHYNEKNGLTFIWASHNKDLVKDFNGKIIELDNGRIIHIGHSCFI
ncbi:MAG: ATP-binding cassette domain-containing protein [Oligoflexia bacterium]|nr:ATP-binding cassette domain-containing protein [Oligoflexia bacterium]